MDTLVADMGGPGNDQLIGRRICGYEVRERIGAGGMGVVYRATDVTLHRDVALKFLPPEMSGEEGRTRFLQEARTASALDHPNIGVIHGLEETDEGRLFIVMAYYEGETLGERIQRGPIPSAQTADIIRQTGRALAEAHSKGIVHRDAY